MKTITDAFGIDHLYHDALGTEHIVDADTRAAILVAMGLSGEATAPPAETSQAVRVLEPDAAAEARALAEPVEIALEDGSARTVDRELPADLPPGYHRLRARSGAETLLIVSPGRCFLPPDLRTWGFAAQLYATRSRASWGIGDLGDLARLGRWAAGLGAGIVMVNPLSAPAPVPPIEPSPYYPSSRRFRNPLYLRIEDVPGWDLLGDDRERLAAAGRALDDGHRIDRDAIFRLKMQALDKIFASFRGDPGFDRFWSEQGDALTQFGTYCALAERHGKDWRAWPPDLRRPDSLEVRRFVTEHARRVRFFAWIEWQVDRQLAEAARAIPIMTDLPIGLDIAGADAWCWQDLMARDVSVGAPPDEFNAGGQDWGLAPFIPFKLRAAGYRPFIETIRAGLRHAGALRIDHVMGLFRLFWIPRALGAKGGTYVRTNADELLAIVALESQRARAFVVGEDLGTVEPGVRERMAEERMLSYRLLYFEPSPPPKYPELALSSVTTHDLATVAGLWTGADVEAQRRIGLQPNEPGMKALRDRLAELGDIDESALVEEAIEKTHRALATAPSRVLLATLDDALAVAERPNMPGTVTEWPNWSLPLPQTLEEIEDADLPRRIATALRR
jgi:4-alpha-glucanotransferase